MATKAHKQAYGEAIQRIRGKNALLDCDLYDIKAGDTVYTYAESSASGMTHYIRLYSPKVGENGALSIENLTYYASLALGWPLVERQGRRYLKVSGGGMDMAFHAVYSLSCVLFGEREGYALKKENL